MRGFWEMIFPGAAFFEGDCIRATDDEGTTYETGPLPHTVSEIYRVSVWHNQGKTTTRIEFFNRDKTLVMGVPAWEVRTVRVAFDIGGVLSKYPDIFRPMIRALVAGGAEVHVITDMHQRAETLAMLRDNGFRIPEANVHNSDFEAYGEACKAVLLRQLDIDVFLDDFPAYLAEGCPVRLQVLPDLGRPYYHDTWKTNGKEGDFGRRTRVKRYVEEDLCNASRRGSETDGPSCSGPTSL